MLSKTTVIPFFLLTALLCLPGHIRAAEASANSGVVTTPDSLRASTRRIDGMIGRRVGEILKQPAAKGGHGGKLAVGVPLDVTIQENAAEIDVSEALTGLAVGRDPSRLNLWGNLSFSRVGGGWDGQDYGGMVYSAVGGADYRLTDRLVLGTAWSYHMLELDTGFNDGTVRGEGLGVIPYAVYTLPPDIMGLAGRFSLDAKAGYGRADSRTTRQGGVGGGYGSDRWLAASNINYEQMIAGWRFDGQAGYLWSAQANPAFTESDGTAVGKSGAMLGEARLGGRLGYPVGRFEPYVKADYFYDTLRSRTGPGSDAGQGGPADVEAGGGIVWTASDRLSGGIEATHGLGRAGADSSSVMTNLRIRF